VAVGASAKPGAGRRPASQHLLWIAAFILFAFVDTAVFVGLMGLPRRLFLVPHVCLTIALAYAYLRWSGVGLHRLIVRRWKVGVAWGVVFSAVSLIKVLGHPVSAVATGWRLVVDLLWSGGAYGVADAVLLTVLPVLAVSRAFAAAGRADGLLDRVGMRVAAVAVSLLITLSYHYGFPEYRERPLDLQGALLGNGVMTVGYLVSGSMLTPIASHVVVHVAAILRGPMTSAVLPPHEGL
jgi:hypothetical protein